MAATVCSSGLSRRSMPRISAPMCCVSGTTSSRVLVATVMTPSSHRFCLPPGLAVLYFTARQGCKNFFHQLARCICAELDRHALAPALGLVDEIDPESVIELSVERMVVINVGCIDAHPAVRALGAPDELGFLN